MMMNEYDPMKDAAESYGAAIAAKRAQLLMQECPAAKRVEVIGACTLYLGDCLEVLPVVGHIDAVIADPPYAIPTMVAQGRTITRNVGDLSIIEGAFAEHVRRWKSALGEEGRIFIFCDGSSYPVMFRAAYGRFNLASLIWDKRKIGMGREFRKRHELIIHGWGAATPVTAADGTGYADVIEVAPVSSLARHHPAEKPVELITSLLRVCGQTILDPFMGSGSTGVAAVGCGKKFVGIEIDETYFDIAVKRIRDAYRQSDIFIDTERPKAEQLSFDE